MSGIDRGMVKQGENSGRESYRNEKGTPENSGKFMILTVCVSFPVSGEAVSRV